MSTSENDKIINSMVDLRLVAVGPFQLITYNAPDDSKQTEKILHALQNCKSSLSASLYLKTPTVISITPNTINKLHTVLNNVITSNEEIGTPKVVLNKLVEMREVVIKDLYMDFLGIENTELDLFHLIYHFEDENHYFKSHGLRPEAYNTVWELSGTDMVVGAVLFVSKKLSSRVFTDEKNTFVGFEVK